jgi:hypothetical protein
MVVNDQNEEEYRREINRAIADTEEEIFQDALGDQELDNDGDRSLEDMGEGLEGEQLEAEGEEQEEAAEPADQEETWAAEEAEPAPEEEQAEAEPEEEEQPAPVQEPPPRGIPAGRLREEAEARRSLEERNINLERELAMLRGRVDEMSAQRNTPQQPATAAPRPPKPDKWTDEQAYDQWMLDEGKRLAEASFKEELNRRDQVLAQQQIQRVSMQLQYAAQGDRGFEINAAYQRLLAMHPDPANPQHVNTVQNVLLLAPDPVNSLLDWWEQNGGPEYREQVFNQLAPHQPQRQQAPRHEVRVPTGIRRPPSLNSAGGGNRMQNIDPEMLDDSDQAVFRYATR